MKKFTALILSATIILSAAICSAEEYVKEYIVVKKGDCLSVVGREKGVRWQEIKKVNGLKSNTIYPGQKLMIPVRRQKNVVVEVNSYQGSTQPSNAEVSATDTKNVTATSSKPNTDGFSSTILEGKEGSTGDSSNDQAVVSSNSISALEALGKATFNLKKPGSQSQVVSAGITGELMYWQKEQADPIALGIGVLGNYSTWNMSHSPDRGYDSKIAPEVGVTYAEGPWYEQLKIRAGYQETGKQQHTKKGEVVTRQKGLGVGAYGEMQYKLQPDLVAIGIADFWTGIGQTTNNGSAPIDQTSLDVWFGVEKQITESLRWRNLIGGGIHSNMGAGAAKSELRQRTPIGTLIAEVHASTDGRVGIGIGLSSKEPFNTMLGDHLASGFNPVVEDGVAITASTTADQAQSQETLIKKSYSSDDRTEIVLASLGSQQDRGNIPAVVTADEFQPNNNQSTPDEGMDMVLASLGNASSNK